MRVKDYSTLKSASKVSFAKVTVDDEQVIQLTEKRFDASTGSALADKVEEISKSEKEELLKKMSDMNDKYLKLIEEMENEQEGN